jgi:hypothetical protein
MDSKTSSAVHFDMIVPPAADKNQPAGAANAPDGQALLARLFLFGGLIQRVDKIAKMSFQDAPETV